jgi:quinol monooxygenase YgiN
LFPEPYSSRKNGEPTRKEEAVIRVIIERHAKEREKLTHLLRELRAVAMDEPGYVTGETLVSTEDSSIIVVISSWSSLEDWKAWETSETRARLYQQVEPFLVEKPKVRTYEILATEERAG